MTNVGTEHHLQALGTGGVRGKRRGSGLLVPHHAAFVQVTRAACSPGPSSGAPHRKGFRQGRRMVTSSGWIQRPRRHWMWRPVPPALQRRSISAAQAQGLSIKTKPRDCRACCWLHLHLSMAKALMRLTVRDKAPHLLCRAYNCKCQGFTVAEPCAIV